MPDVRVVLRELAEKAKSLHQRERLITVESIELIGKLDRMNAAVNLNMTSEKFAIHIGLTPGTYWRRAQVARILARFPKAKEMLEAGDTEVTHLAIAAPKLTPANQELLLSGIKGKSQRDVAAFVSRVTPDGRILEREGTVELKIELTESQLKKLDRAREVLAAGGKVPPLVEIFMKSLDDLLRRRDPQLKAERMAKKHDAKKKSESAVTPQHLLAPPVEAEESRPSPVDPVGMPPPVKLGRGRRTTIPARTEHAVRLRDEGRCTWIFEDGSRCTARMMLEVDHLLPVCRGGSNELRNLALKCRIHNQAASINVLGEYYATRWRESKVTRDMELRQGQ